MKQTVEANYFWRAADESHQKSNMRFSESLRRSSYPSNSIEDLRLTLAFLVKNIRERYLSITRSCQLTLQDWTPDKSKDCKILLTLKKIKSRVSRIWTKLDDGCFF